MLPLFQSSASTHWAACLHALMPRNIALDLQEYKPSARDWLSSFWKGFFSPDQMARIRNTGVPMDFLKEVT